MTDKVISSTSTIDLSKANCSSQRLAEIITKFSPEEVADFVQEEREFSRDSDVVVIYDLLAMLKEASDRETRLRAALAQGPGNCVYCSLSKEDWAKCQSGFPGCARGDDAMGCPELGARQEAGALKSQLIICSRQFRFYEQQHRAKNTPESTIKAEVNADIAAQCEEFLR